MIYMLTYISQGAFAERAQRLGYTIDSSSVGALMRSIEAVQDPTARNVLELFLQKASPRAKYFCAGMLDIAKYGHYALNIPLYSHFTSPIRRYADIIVHRQLDAILQGGREYGCLLRNIAYSSQILQRSPSSTWIGMPLQRLRSNVTCTSRRHFS